MRAASGLSAADYFGFSMESLFLWGKIIKELAVLGYDESSMHMAAYDWRISMADLEQRDRYFTKLKAVIEELVAANDGEKVLTRSSEFEVGVRLELMVSAIREV